MPAETILGGLNAEATQQQVLVALQNIDSDIGAKADAPASDDSGSFGLISLFKRSLGYLASIVNRTPVLGAAAPGASSPVTLPNDVVAGVAAAIQPINMNLLSGVVSDWFDASNFHSASIHIIGGAGITAGAIFFEQTNDPVAAPAGVPWAIDETNVLTPTPSIAATAIAANASRMFGGSITSRYVRVRVSTAFAGGTIQAVGVFSQLPYFKAVQTVHQATAGNLQVTAALTSATARTGFVGAAGIWYDDTSTLLAANASFTGALRDLANSATAVAFASNGTYAKEVRVSAETDVSGTLWIEVSRDNGTIWRRVKAVPTVVVSGGGHYAEIVHQPSWRYIRVGFTNGATVQTRLIIGSMTLAA
jgi:hypothetical protein